MRAPIVCRIGSHRYGVNHGWHKFVPNERVIYALKSNNRAYGYSSNFHSLCLCGVSNGIYLVRVRIKMRRGESF